MQLKNIFLQNYKKNNLTSSERQEIFKYLNISFQKTEGKLKNLILNYIGGKDISIKYIEHEISQLKIEYYQQKNFNKDYYNFLSFLKNNTRSDNPYLKIYKSFKYVEDWKKIIKIYEIWQNINNIDYSSLLNNFSLREKMIAKVSSKLQKYKIKIKNGKFILEKEKLQKIQMDIENLIKKIGGPYCLKYIFQQLQYKYDPDLQRYIFPKQFVNFYEEPKLEIPYNFLINISLKYIKEEGKTKYKSKKYLNKLFNLASKYIFLYDLQDFHNINKNLFPHQWTIKTLYKNILYDNLFRFKQISIYNITLIIENLFNTKFEKKLGFSLNDYLNLIRKLYSVPNNFMIKFPFEIFTNKEDLILNLISHHYMDINQQYNKPEDFTKINFTLKPLIKLKNYYLLVDKNYCAWNFYEIILKMLNYPNIGTNLENLIYKQLINRKYKLYKGKYINSKNEKGECDIVIETEKKIIFIEIKKKSITSKAIEGDEIKIAEDIIDSFIHSQEQILKHEYSLKLDKKIEFENGEILEFNNKKIVKISVSLFDNYMLNDKLIALNIFEFFQKIKFINTKDNKKLKEKNKKITNIIEKLNLIYKYNPQEYRKNRFDIYFLSLELFLFYLQINKPIDEVLQDIRQISFGTGDLYFEYKKLKEILND